LFSNEKKCRFSLERIWDSNKKQALVIGINPSFADQKLDDPTVSKLITLCRYNDFGGFILLNLFPFISTQPIALDRTVGLKKNRILLENFVSKSESIICIWGNTLGQMPETYNFLNAHNLLCFGTNKNGSPKHPLYLKGDTLLKEYQLGSIVAE